MFCAYCSQVFQRNRRCQKGCFTNWRGFESLLYPPVHYFQWPLARLRQKRAEQFLRILSRLCMRVSELIIVLLLVYLALAGLSCYPLPVCQVLTYFHLMDCMQISLSPTPSPTSKTHAPERRKTTSLASCLLLYCGEERRRGGIFSSLSLLLLCSC